MKQSAMNQNRRLNIEPAMITAKGNYRLENAKLFAIQKDLEKSV